MVKALHRAGIEVILDVVYNHTGEGSHLGPTLTLRGIDNAAYYRLVEDDPATTWTSRAAATPSTCAIPKCLKLIMDSLRYWVQEMHVDGFRFDLASAWRGNSTKWTASPPFSTSSTKTPSSPPPS
jgi:isoamylase